MPSSGAGGRQIPPADGTAGFCLLYARIGVQDCVAVRKEAEVESFVHPEEEHMSDRNDSTAVTKPVQPARRRLLKAAGIAAGGAALSAPFIRNAAAAETTTWKVQTSWPAGVGLQTFKTWCAGIKEKTGGELEFKGFAAKEVVGDLEHAVPYPVQQLEVADHLFGRGKERRARGDEFVHAVLGR